MFVINILVLVLGDDSRGHFNEGQQIKAMQGKSR